MNMMNTYDSPDVEPDLEVGQLVEAFGPGYPANWTLATVLDMKWHPGHQEYFYLLFVYDKHEREHWVRRQFINPKLSSK